MRSALLFLAAASLISSQPTPVVLPNAPCTATLPRKEIRDLSQQEWSRYVNAVKAIQRNGIYDALVKFHLDFQTSIHSYPVFLPWHRYYVRLFEMHLQIIDPTVTVPYWNWAFDAQAPETSPILSNQYLGSNGQGSQNCVQDGAFAGWQPYYPQGRHCMRRQFDLANDAISSFYGPEVINAAMNNNPTYDQFRAALETPIHGVVHTNIGSDFSTMSSPNDPIFFSHHAFIDKIYTEWQQLQSASGMSYAGTNQDGTPALPTDILKPFGSFTVADVLDSTTLCYQYVEMAPGHVAGVRGQTPNNPINPVNPNNPANPNNPNNPVNPNNPFGNNNPGNNGFNNGFNQNGFNNGFNQNQFGNGFNQNGFNNGFNQNQFGNNFDQNGLNNGFSNGQSFGGSNNGFNGDPWAMNGGFGNAGFGFDDNNGFQRRLVRRDMHETRASVPGSPASLPPSSLSPNGALPINMPASRYAHHLQNEPNGMLEPDDYPGPRSTAYHLDAIFNAPPPRPNSPAVFNVSCTDRTNLLAIRTPRPLPDWWAKMNNVPIAELRTRENRYANLCVALNRIPDYVSPSAIINNNPTLVQLAPKVHTFYAVVNGSTVVPAPAASLATNGVRSANQIAQNVRQTVQKHVDPILQRAVTHAGQLAARLRSIIGPIVHPILQSTYPSLVAPISSTPVGALPAGQSRCACAANYDSSSDSSESSSSDSWSDDSSSDDESSSSSSSSDSGDHCHANYGNALPASNGASPIVTAQVNNANSAYYQ